MTTTGTIICWLPWQPDTYAAGEYCAATPPVSNVSDCWSDSLFCVCVCVVPGAELRRHAAEADHRYLQCGGPRVLGGSSKGPGRQERGAQGRVEPPAETQRGARGAGH